MVKKSYSSFDEGKANSAFAKRLREEFLTDSVKVQQLADSLGCSTQAINQYKQGTSFPKMENLIKIAEFYNCSLDYLIGLSDVKSPEADLQSVCAYTGLSELSVSVLHNNAEYRNKHGEMDSLASFDTVEESEQYPYVNDGLLNAVNILLEFGNETDFFEMLLNYVYSDDIEFLDDNDRSGLSYSLKFRNGKVSSFDYQFLFDSSRLEALAMLQLQDSLRRIHKLCVPDFEQTLLGTRKRALKVLFEEMQEYQDDEESE